MSIPTQIIAAFDDEGEAIGDASSPIDLWSGIGLRDMTIARIAMLPSVLTGGPFDGAAAQCEPVYVSPVEGALVLRLGDELKERLANRSWQVGAFMDRGGQSAMNG